MTLDLFSFTLKDIFPCIVQGVGWHSHLKGTGLIVGNFEKNTWEVHVPRSCFVDVA